MAREARHFVDEAFFVIFGEYLAEFSKKLLTEAKLAAAPGVGFGEYGDDHVRLALIENEERIRQAIRGIKDMFRKDGVLDALDQAKGGELKVVK